MNFKKIPIHNFQGKHCKDIHTTSEQNIGSERITILTSFYVFSYFESSKIWAAGLVVGELCENPSHWNKRRSLHQWLCEQVWLKVFDQASWITQYFRPHILCTMFLMHTYFFIEYTWYRRHRYKSSYKGYSAAWNNAGKNRNCWTRQVKTKLNFLYTRMGVLHIHNQNISFDYNLSLIQTKLQRNGW